MKVLESSPKRYDQGIKLLTFGKITKYHEYIASKVHPGQTVLDLGCGTGMLSVKLALRGANVIGIDINPQMLDLAKKQLEQASAKSKVSFQQGNALDLDEFERESFDVITASLLFSELSDNEKKFLLHEIHRVLKPSGILVIGDEITPRNFIKRIMNTILRIPLVLLTYFLTQTTTRPVKNMDVLLGDAGFEILERKENLLGNFAIWVAKKTS